MTDAVAASADPSHIEDPIPTNIDTFEGIFINLINKYETISEVEIVETIINNDSLPTLNIWKKFISKPSKMIAYSNIFFDVNLIPASKELLRGKSVITKSNKIPNTDPPIIEKFSPRK